MADIATLLVVLNASVTLSAWAVMRVQVLHAETIAHTFSMKNNQSEHQRIQQTIGGPCPQPRDL
jgi:hypothetical protein